MTSLATIVVVVLAICGCTSNQRIPYTEAEASNAVIPGMPNVRYWADAPAELFEAGLAPKVRQPLTYLALSGGGSDGAFSAGILNGWTASGRRPEFTIVSGVSTGALIAPLAFLGPAYDGILKKAYTSGEAELLIQYPSIFGGLFGAGIYNGDRLRKWIGRYVDDAMLSVIAREHAKGRRLLVITTHLDSQRAVIWDMGAIAASGRPNARKLFRDVLAASASVPVVFTPTLIDVEANGRKFEEMHVDGAVARPVFTLPNAFLLGTAQSRTLARRLSLYIIINSTVGPNFEVVPENTIAIASRSTATSSTVKTQAILAGTYKAAQRAGFNFYLTYIDEEAALNGTTGFETDQMRRLYNYGYEKARFGGFWQTMPPQAKKSPPTEPPDRSLHHHSSAWSSRAAPIKRVRIREVK
ncbi:patatin-like phospholipase family protein [Chelativorans sp. AA-79]|uniref:patatin-like phospholipase family protein n=1 Tax=Chelativorans sp. AA-79 TaxID=3028735 RepID=UPI0023F90D09|nr:patatin-like phospholipase family protein [Chelativorans sp. AA-79]WEX12163.1 patatin-like phospholipase family protein [Chelativorans sp. AA-79]